MKDLIKDVLEFFGTALIIASIIGLVAVFPINHLMKKTCYYQSKAMGFGYDYGILQGCIIKTPNGNIPIDKYIMVNGSVKEVKK